MYNLLLRLMLIVTLLQLGISLTDIEECRGRECAQKLEKAKNEVLKINWKPISVFPEEAKRFR